MRRVRLEQVLDRALRCALLSGLAACGGNAAEQGTSSLSPPFSFADEPPVVGEEPTAPGDDPTVPPQRVDSSAVGCLAAGTSRFDAMTLSDYDFVALRSASGTLSPEPDALPLDRREL